MKPTVFIQTNRKQILGAHLAAYAIRRNLPTGSSIQVEILNVDEMPLFSDFVGKSYLRGGSPRTFTLDDLQSFTLTRFMPPERMGYEGRAVVIDPDIFALTDITPLMENDLQGHALSACRKKHAWDSSVMVLDCAKLRTWNLKAILNNLADHSLDYNEVMRLENESSILELSRDWNSLDVLSDHTKLLHTTNRLTQPWKAGLPIDFTREKLRPVFGFIPREPIWKLLGKYPSHYQTHPDKRIEQFFLALLKDAVRDGVVDGPFLEGEIQARHIRQDIQAYL